MTYEDTPIDGLSVVDATDDPWLEIANELQEFQRRHAEIAATVTLPAARHIGELLDNLQQQYDNNADFLAEAEARVGLHKSQIYAYLGVHRGWEKIQAGIAAGHEIASIKEAGRFLSGASQAPKALKSAADPDAEDGDHTGAECPLPAPAAVVPTVVDVDAQGPAAPALTALAAVPAACRLLMSEVPTDRPDLVEALQKLNADAESLARRIRSAMAQAVVPVPVEVCQIELPEPAPGVDPADQLLAAGLGMDAADIASGDSPAISEGAADSTGGKQEVAADQAGASPKKKSNRGAITGTYPMTTDGVAAFEAALARCGNQTQLAKELGCKAKAVSLHVARVREFLEAS